MSASLQRLWFFLFCLLAGECFADDYFYRADSREPGEFQSRRIPGPGIYSRGVDDAYDANGARIPNVSLYRHALGTPDGNTRYDDGYVSTTRSLTMAHNIGQQMLGAYSRYYIYVIVPGPNLYDVNAVLGRYSPHPMEGEFAALGGIPWSQVAGWYVVEWGRMNPVMVRNPRHQPRIYASTRLPLLGESYRLAGFPENHRAWREPPWANYAAPGCGATPRKRSLMPVDVCLKNQVDMANEKFVQFSKLVRRRLAALSVTPSSYYQE
ncbi:MAG TPA: enterotoxin A family protein [Pseudomonas sp.]